MKTCKIIFAIFLLSPALFLGCGPSGAGVGEAATSTLRKADSQGGASGGVVLQTPTPETPTPQATATQSPSSESKVKVIATQPGSGGVEVDLTNVEVTGEVLTVALRYRNITASLLNAEVDFPIDQVSITDDATSRRYGVLKDQSGRYMASPLSGERSIKFSVVPQSVSPGFYEVAWFKFPAPPAPAQTISINVPRVAPFDKVRIQR